MFFQNLCGLRKPNLDGDVIEQMEWIWPVKDQGGWTIPKNEWLGHHSQKWFQHVKKFDLAVQAGGCCGMYPRILSKFFQCVYTFEPSPLNFYALVNNCQSNHVIKIQAVLGEHAASTQLVINETNVGMNKPTGEMGYFPVLTLDSFNLPACDLLAFDLEETEMAALKGSIHTIKRHSPVVIVENGDKHGINGFMHELGYRDIEQSALDVIFIKP